jgi:hypothetical protein
MHNSFVVQEFLFGFARETSSSKLVVQFIEVVDLLVVMPCELLLLLDNALISNEIDESHLKGCDSSLEPT